MGARKFGILAGRSAALVVLLSVGARAMAVPLGYAVDTQTRLWQIDLGSADATLIGTMGVLLQDIAYSPDGRLFGTRGRVDNGSLFEISTTDASATLIGNTGRGNTEGLDFHNGTLVGADFATTPTLFSIGVGDAVSVDLVTAPVRTGRVRSITALDDNHMLIRGDDPGLNSLYSMSLIDGSINLIGDVPGQLLSGLDFALDGQLYGLNTAGQVLLIDPDTAATVVIGDTGSQVWLGLAAIGEIVLLPDLMTVAVIPEPVTGTLCVIGIGTLVLASRRRG